MRKSGALSSPCGYSLLIAVITAVASWMIAITKGSHFFIFFLSKGFTFLHPLYPILCTKTTVYFDFYKQKKPPHQICSGIFNPHIKGANIYFLKGQKRGKLSLQCVTICYSLPFQIAI